MGGSPAVRSVIIAVKAAISGSKRGSFVMLAAFSCEGNAARAGRLRKMGLCR
jgi:hypothetical protein